MRGASAWAAVVGCGILAACSSGGLGGDASRGADAPSFDGAADAEGGAAPDVPMGSDVPDAFDAASFAPEVGPDGADADAQRAEPFPLLVSGTRLRVKSLQAADGAISQTTFHDTVLAVDCAFQPFEEAGRCLPDDRRLGVVFADDKCTIPLVFAEPCTAAAWGEVSTAKGKMLYKRGTPVAKPAAVWSVAVVDGSCNLVNGDFGRSQFATAQRFPIESFVATTGTSVVETRPGLRFGARYLVGADGSRARVGIRDMLRGSDCNPQVAADGIKRCFTGEFPETSFALYGDDKCSQRVVISESSPPPSHATRPTNASFDPLTECDTKTSLVAVVAVHAGPVYAARFTGNACYEQPLAAGAVAYEVGAIDESARLLGELTDELQGTARLRVPGMRGSDGSVFAGGGARFIDSRFSESCTPSSVVGGGVRCLPPRSSAWDNELIFYADTDCATRLYIFPDERCSLGARVTSHYVAHRSTQCELGPAEKVFARGGGPDLATFAGGGGLCSSSNAFNAYHLGPEVPLTEFVALEEKVE
jgi:hypothetical protein